MSDTITLLQTAPDCKAAKTWLLDGTTADYNAGAWFLPHTVPVADLPALSRLLTSIETRADILAIRGTFKGPDVAAGVMREKDGYPFPATSNGWYRRWLELYGDDAHRWICIDIDSYVPPPGIDPVADPVAAIREFVADHLPPEFTGAGFHWQLSNSASHPAKRVILKAHLWFWLAEPRNCSELTAWADTVGPAIDRTLYRAVQVHYTANPIMAPGVVDPVPVRSGLVTGHDVVLVITDAMRTAVRDASGDREMLDPRTKTGVVGAFCRAYSIRQVLAGTLASTFVFQRGSDRRLTWLQGGGAEGGAYICDDELHIANTHNTSPNGPGAINAFDAVRIYCFGHLDEAPGVDRLALAVMSSRPSYRAMCRWAQGLPEVAAILAPPPGAAAAAMAGDDVSQPTVTPIAGETLLFPAAQPAYFANCVYVASIHRILTPDGEVYDQQRFNAMFGGRSFVMDDINERRVRAPWECFLESQALTFPKVSGRLFRPEMPPYSIVRMEGASYVNTYVPIETKQVQGDPAPFLGLLAKLLPNQRDRDILLTYMASLLRNPGVKFQWWPVIQGCEGNGKSALFYIMSHCVGHRYTEELNVAEMAKNGIKFNSWIVGTLLLIMEEIYVENRRHFLEEFKPIVTNKRIPVEQKGIDKTTEDNRANGMMGTNHQDGVPITADSRRYAIFYTAQQTAEDKLRDGMTPAYFADFYDWVEGRGAYSEGGATYGCAVVNWWLRTQYVLVDEFDPARSCQVAPKTSSSAAAIKNSMGPIEQDILEAIESDQEGFRGDWVSSIALEKLFEKGRRSLARNKRRGLLQSLGYDWHPHLRDGRTTHGNALKGHPGKFTLYCKINSESSKITDVSKIMERYFTDQKL